MPSIAQRPNGKWRARFDDDTGRSRARHFDRKADAQQWLAEQVANLARGQWVDWKAGRRTFGDYAEQWAKQQIQHRPNTRSITRSRLDNHILPTFKHRPIAAVSRSEVQAWVAERSEHLAPSTVEAVYRLLSQLFAAAVDDRIIAVSPCRRVSLPERKPRGELVPLEVTEVIAVAGRMPSRLAVSVWLGAGAGLRTSEVLGLTVDRVDFLRRTVRVDRQLADVANGRPVFGPPKTKASSATVPLGQVTLDALAAHLAEHGPGRDGLLVVDRRGWPLRRNRFTDAWHAAVKAAEMPEATRFHDLRHVYASLLIRAGLSPKAVQARLRHATISETFDTYGHLWPDDEERTRTAVDEAFAVPEKSPESGTAGGNTG